jgi:hypothetical protein
MSRISVTLILAFLLIFHCCIIPQKEFDSHRKVLLSPKGERIKVTTEDQKKWEGEFIFHDEQFVYLLMENKQEIHSEVMSIPIETIVHIKVDIFINRQWKWYILGFQIIPAIVLGLTYAAYSDDTGGGLGMAGVLSIPGGLSYLLFSTSQPKQPKLKGKIDYEKLKELQKYARYPFIPNPEQKRKILENLVKNFR